MKTLKILKQFLKQKAGEFWTILKFDTDYTIPTVVRNWVVTIVYGPILFIILYYIGLLTSYIVDLPIKSTTEHVLAAIVGVCAIVIIFVISIGSFVLFIQGLFVDFIGWVKSNWNQAKHKVEENEKTKP